jgi:hypothetical protein
MIYYITSGGKMPSNTDESKRYWLLEDPRKTGLKNGLRQLTIEQLQRVIDYQGEMVLDSYNYEGGKFCPLTIAVELDKTIINPTHEKVFDALTSMGYKVYNTRGIPGEFYTNNRLEDLLEAAKEVLQEKTNQNANCKSIK